MIPLVARVIASQAAKSAAKREVTATVAKSGAKTAVRGRFWRNLRGGFSETLNAGWQLQSWEALFENHFPSVVNSAAITAVGQKGTPSKHVLHVALAAAFGVLARGQPIMADVGLRVAVDHMNNAVRVEYGIRYGQFGATRGAAAKVIGGAYAAVAEPQPGSDAVVRAKEKDAPKMPDGAGKGMDAAGAKDVPPPAGATIEDKSINSFNNFYNLHFADSLWGDPANAHQATIFASLAKETVQAGLPPVLLVPRQVVREGVPFPEPYQEMVKDLIPFLKQQNPATEKANGADIVTRLPFLSDGKTVATNPLPPVPRDPAKAWQYARTPAHLQIAPEMGYDFDLRSLVAQALSDPGVTQPVPDTNLSLRPQ